MKRLFITTFLSAGVFVAYSQQIPKWKITDVEKMIHSGNGDILIINFWATFCKPCVAEIPSFIKVTNKYKNEPVKLYLVSVDLPSAYPGKIAKFAKEKNFTTNISWLAETNADYFCPKIDNSWSGSIPATLIVNTKTGARKFFEGEIKEAAFEAALQSVMDVQVQNQHIHDPVVPPAPPQ